MKMKKKAKNGKNTGEYKDIDKIEEDNKKKKENDVSPNENKIKKENCDEIENAKVAFLKMFYERKDAAVSKSSSPWTARRLKKKAEQKESGIENQNQGKITHFFWTAREKKVEKSIPTPAKRKLDTFSIEEIATPDTPRRKLRKGPQ